MICFSETKMLGGRKDVIGNKFQDPQVYDIVMVSFTQVRLSAHTYQHTAETRRNLNIATRSSGKHVHEKNTHSNPNFI